MQRMSDVSVVVVWMVLFLKLVDVRCTLLVLR
jgi:hypothetical protein